MKSIRSTLLVRLIAGLALVLALAAATLFALVRQQLYAQFDGALADKARLLASAIRQETDARAGQAPEIELELGETPSAEFGGPHPSGYFEVRSAQGTLFRSESLAGGQLAVPMPVTVTPVFRDVRLPDGRPGRSIGFQFLPTIETPAPSPRRPQPPLSMLVAQERESLTERLRAIGFSLGAFALALLIAMPIVVARVVPRGLRPLEALARELQTIDAGSLDHRVGTSGVPAELQPIALRMNQLLERLQAGFERERRFSADVAHELRTPIAELRTLAEVAMDSARSDGGSREMREALDIALQMERLVVGLLTLARSEAGVAVATASDQANPLGPLLTRVWQAHAAEAERKRLRWSLPAAGEPRVLAPVALLEMVLGNLIENAVAYTTDGGAITVAWRDADEGGSPRVGVAITNPDVSLTPADLAQVFDRLWRKDSARSDGRHSGLGLAIAAAAARQMNGRLVADRPEPGAVRFTLWLPPAPAEPAGAGG